MKRQARNDRGKASRLRRVAAFLDKQPTRYMTVFPRSATARYWHICTVHRSFRAAVKAADTCEAADGAKHSILEFRVMPRGEKDL